MNARRATYLQGLACIATTAMLTTGCTTLEEQLPDGTTSTEMLRAMGTPDVTCPLPGGGERWVWSGQPFFQASWATEVRPDNTTTGLEQVLTDESFDRLRQGTWHIDQVRCTWGPPADITGVGWGNNVHTVWSYSYRQGGVWNSLMHVYFDPAGQVTRHHPGPDPMYDPNLREM